MNPMKRWFARKRLDRELAAEMSEHLAERVEQLMEQGQSEPEARANARRQFGNPTRQQETSREAWGWTGLEQAAQDVRFATRVLRRSPLVTVSAILTLTLGIGANTAILTLIDKLLLRPLPVHEPERLVQLVVGKHEQAVFGYVELEALEQESKTLEGLFTWNATSLSLGWGADARTVAGAVASGRVYQTLGLRAQAGRLFGPSDDAPGAPAVAVISDRFWESEFQRNPMAIGPKLTLERHLFTVIGVTPRDFASVFAGAAPAITIPFRANSDLHPKWDMLHTKRMQWLSILGRLKPGVTIAVAQAELRVLSPQIAKATSEPGAPMDPPANHLSVRSGATGTNWNSQEFRKALFVLAAVSGLVLLIACVNLANLLMARAAAREKEMSVRLALGAGRGRLIRQMLTESLLLSSAGAVLGAEFAWCGTKLALKLLPMMLDPAPDWRVLLYLMGLAIATGVLFGVVPAMRGTDLETNHALTQAKIGFERRWSLGNGLVVTQVALSAMLLLGALLFVRTLENLKTQATGFSRENLGFIALDSERAGMNGQQLRRFYDELLADMRTLPAVRAVSLSTIVPLTGSWISYPMNAKQWPNLSEVDRTVYTNQVAPGYFSTVGMPLEQGRDFDLHDAASKEKLVILSANAAHTYFPRGDAVGQLLREGNDGYRVIGVVGDAKYTGLRDSAPRTMFQPAMVGSEMTANGMMAGTTWNLIVRARTDLGPVLSAVRAFVRSSKRDVAIGPATPLDEAINGSLFMERLLAILISFFAALAAALVAIGLYGVLGYTVTRRTSEIGVRLALGATARQILWMVLAQALLVTAAGVVVGVAAGLACQRFISAMLFEAKPTDPSIIVATVGLLLALGLIAGLLPARRASKLDPMVALRWE